MGFVDARLREWIVLGLRLFAVSPHKVPDVISLVTGIVEGQEVIARADELLILRGKRPSKQYDA